MYQLKLVIFVLLNLVVLSSCTTNSTLISNPIDDILRNYDARFRPNFGRYAVNVEVSTYVTKLYDYSEADSVKLNKTKVSKIKTKKLSFFAITIDC